MATAKKILPAVVPPTIIQLEISLAEAQMLQNVLATIGGSGNTLTGVYRALDSIGIKFQEGFSKKNFKFEPGVTGGMLGGSIYIASQPEQQLVQ